MRIQSAEWGGFRSSRHCGKI